MRFKKQKCVTKRDKIYKMLENLPKNEVLTQRTSVYKGTKWGSSGATLCKKAVIEATYMS